MTPCQEIARVAGMLTHDVARMRLRPWKTTVGTLLVALRMAQHGGAKRGFPTGSVLDVLVLPTADDDCRAIAMAWADLLESPAAGTAPVRLRLVNGPTIDLVSGTATGCAVAEVAGNRVRASAHGDVAILGFDDVLRVDRHRIERASNAIALGLGWAPGTTPLHISNDAVMQLQSQSTDAVSIHVSSIDAEPPTFAVEYSAPIRMEIDRGSETIVQGRRNHDVDAVVLAHGLPSMIRDEVARATRAIVDGAARSAREFEEAKPILTAMRETAEEVRQPWIRIGGGTITLGNEVTFEIQHDGYDDAGIREETRYVVHVGRPGQLAKEEAPARRAVERSIGTAVGTLARTGEYPAEDHEIEDGSRDRLYSIEMPIANRLKEMDAAEVIPLLRRLMLEGGRAVDQLPGDKTRLRMEGTTIAGTIALGSMSRWDKGALRIEGHTLPDTYASALVGRPVDDLIQHPLLDGCIIGAVRSRSFKTRPPQLVVHLKDGAVTVADFIESIGGHPGAD